MDKNAHPVARAEVALHHVDVTAGADQVEVPTCLKGKVLRDHAAAVGAPLLAVLKPIRLRH